MNEIIEVINIPKERIAVLIGTEGKIRKKIEKETGVKINVDSKTGEVEIIRSFEVEDQLKAIKSQDLVKAIARGFAPQKAFKLLLPNVYLEIIDLTEFVSDKSLDRIRSRIIGKEGKSRQLISKLTETEIVIYGKTVSMIGDAEKISIAKEAILKIIKGAIPKKNAISIVYPTVIIKAVSGEQSQNPE